jgi:apolipoprotein N-acyltransferase
VLFPGTAWLGLVVTLIICSSACVDPRILATITSLLFVIAHAAYHPPALPASWQSIDTSFGAGFNASNPSRELEIAETIQRIIRNSNNNVLIFPEMVIHRWNVAAETFWQPTLNYLKESDKTILVGAGISLPGPGQSYLNAVMILGSHPGPPFIQRIPVPIAMWKPYKPSDCVPLRLLGTSTTMVGRRKLAILICYEQLLVWPILASAAENPDILLGIANDYWAEGTSINAIQGACLRAWARLFKFPLFFSTNT